MEGGEGGGGLPRAKGEEGRHGSKAISAITHTQTHTHTHEYMHIYACVCARAHTHMPTRMSGHLSDVCVCVCVCMYMYMPTRMSCHLSDRISSLCSRISTCPPTHTPHAWSIKVQAMAKGPLLSLRASPSAPFLPPHTHGSKEVKIRSMQGVKIWLEHLLIPSPLPPYIHTVNSTNGQRQGQRHVVNGMWSTAW